MGEIMLVNPRKRKSTKGRKRNATGQFVRAVKNPAPKRRTARRARPSAKAASNAGKTLRRYRRNPSGRGIGALVMPAFTGAAGAVAVDLVAKYLPLPVALKVGPMRHAVKAGLGVLLGMVGGKIVKGTTAAQAANGALTVALHGLMAEQAARVIPGGLSAYPELGAYVDMQAPALGYYSPGAIEAGTLPESLEMPTDAMNVGEYAYSETGPTY